MSPQISKEYVDTGKVRWIFRNFAFLTQDSLNAAEAAYCANEQDKFWPLKEVLYANQGSESATTFSKEQLKKLAKDAGIEPTAFNTCLDSGKYSAQVAKDRQYGEQQGVQGTPTFMINGRPVNVMDRDPQTTLKNFRRELDAALASTK